MKFASLSTTCCVLLVLLGGCGQNESPPGEGSQGASVERGSPVETSSEPRQEMKVTSSAFEHGQTIDAKYTEDGQDVSPPLSWSGAPSGTESFALVAEDPDAPSPKKPADEPWVHWVLFNIPADRTQLPEAVSQDATPEEIPEARQGANSWPEDNVGYRGPAPPQGSGEHRYFFRIYALDTTLDLEAGASKKQLLDAMSGHVLAEGELMGVYER